MLTAIEQRALEMLLVGDREEFVALRAQLNAASVARREYTGVGFFTHFSVPADSTRLKTRGQFVIGDLYAEITGLQHDAGFLLFVTDGIISMLECFIVDDRWPDDAVLHRAYYVHPAVPGTSNLVETKERDLEWALRDAV
jgi:hypothetical protein